MSTLTSIANQILLGFGGISQAVMGGIFLGSVGVIGGGLVSHFLEGTHFFGVPSSDDYPTGSMILTLVFCISACLGSAIGVYRREIGWSPIGFFLATLGGSILGGGFGAGGGFLIDGKMTAAIFCLLGSSLGATIGFHLTRRIKLGNL